MNNQQAQTATATVRIVPPTILEKKIAYGLLGAVIFLLVAYLYLVNQTVWNIVARQNLTKEINSVSSSVATLESSYMTLSSSLTIDHAYAMGFQDVSSSDTVFVNRPAPAAVAFR